MGWSKDDLARLGPHAQEQIKKQLGEGGKPGKYHSEPAQRTLPGGKEHTFASRREARRYDELAALLAAGSIRNLKLQPQFTLQESYITPEGERVRAIRYVADFSFERKTLPDQNGSVYWVRVVEDAKGVRTKDYLVKRKLMQERMGIRVTEI